MNNWLPMRHLDLVFDWVYCEILIQIFHINTLFDEFNVPGSSDINLPPVSPASR